MNAHTVYDAATGTCILDSVTGAQFDNWYAGHDDYRSVRDISEVNPAFRDLYDAISDRPNVHWLRQDAA